MSRPRSRFNGRGKFSREYEYGTPEERRAVLRDHLAEREQKRREASAKRRQEMLAALDLVREIETMLTDRRCDRAQTGGEKSQGGL
jgi:uncharacterized membrane protein